MVKSSENPLKLLVVMVWGKKKANASYFSCDSDDIQKESLGKWI